MLTEIVTDEPEDAAMAVGARSLWFPTECWIWCVGDECDEWGALTISPDSDEPPPGNHWLNYELDAVGTFEEAMGVDDVETMLLNEGVAPEQPFLLHLTFRSDYYPATPNGPAEYDTHVEWAVVAVEPWHTERIMLGWEAFWGRRHLMEGI